METRPTDTLDEQTIFSDQSTINALLSQSYADVLSFYTAYAFPESNTPNGIQSELHKRHEFPIEKGIDPTNLNGKDDRFLHLQRINFFIKKASESSVLTDEQKREKVAEARFLRGLNYFSMTRNQGRFVPINQVLSLEDTLLMRREMTSDPGVSYQVLMEDIDAGIQDLPETSESGRLNKYVALGYKSRIALQAYAYTKEEKYLDDAIASAEAVINSNRYELSPNYGQLFLFAGADDKEILLNRQYLKLNTDVSSFDEMIRVVPNVKNDEISGSGGSPLFNNPNGRSFEGNASYFPTQDLVDQYLVTENGQAKEWNETDEYKKYVEVKEPTALTVNEFTRKPNAKDPEKEKVGWHAVPDKADLGSNAKGKIITYYATTKEQKRINDIIYKNRDKRFYDTIVYDSCYWLNKELVTTCVQGNLAASVRRDKSSSWYTTVTGYYWRKAVEEVSPRVYADTPINYHFVLLRLGEIYLNLAEAKLLKKDYAGAVAALNQTRTTHGKLPPSTATTEEEVWKDYIRERRVEMAYENDIYYSYLRWGKYGGAANHNKPAGAPIVELNKPVHRIVIKKDRQAFFIAQVIVNESWDRNFSPKRYLYPIGQGFLDRRAAYGINDQQNPGW